jgi:hypothetical protein
MVRKQQTLIRPGRCVQLAQLQMAHADRPSLVGLRERRKEKLNETNFYIGRRPIFWGIFIFFLDAKPGKKVRFGNFFLFVSTINELRQPVHNLYRNLYIFFHLFVYNPDLWLIAKRCIFHLFHCWKIHIAHPL